MAAARGATAEALAGTGTGDAFWADLLDGERRLLDLEQMTMLERVELVRNGVPAGVLPFLGEAMEVSKDRLYHTIGLPRSTGERKVREGARLDADQSERVLGLARLIGRVQQIVEESGDPTDFDAARWVADWLDEPLTALGGRRPADLMDTAEGRALVLSFVGQMQAGTYA